MSEQLAQLEKKGGKEKDFYIASSYFGGYRGDAKPNTSITIKAESTDRGALYVRCKNLSYITIPQTGANGGYCDYTTFSNGNVVATTRYSGGAGTIRVDVRNADEFVCTFYKSPSADSIISFE